MTNSSTLYIANGVYNVSYVTISIDLTIIGEDVNNTILQSTSSSGLFNITSTTTLSNLSITGNTSSIKNYGTLTLDNVRVYNITNTNSGNSLIANYGNISVNNSSFSNIYSYYGSIIYDRSTEFSSIIINNSYFESIGSKSTRGGVFYFSYSNVTLENSSYNKTYASSYGSMIYAQYSNITIYNTNISNSGLNSTCAVIYLSYSNLTTNSSQISSSKVNKSMIYARNSTVNMVNSEFNDNIANQWAGVLDLEGSSATITSCTFNNNTALYNAGGVIYAYNSNITINDSSFTNNTAILGGAITTFNGSASSNKIIVTPSTTTILNSNFTNNVAVYGGAIYDIYANVGIENSIFTDNSAEYSGGAIYINNGTLIMENSSLQNNNATNFGGAIYAYVSVLDISYSNLTYNNADTGADLYSRYTESLTSYQNVVTNRSSLVTNDTATYESSVELIITSLNDENTTYLPSSYDLRDEGYVTSVKYQGSGGNCWAFATLGTLESCILKATGLTYDLSESNMKNLMALYSITSWPVNPNAGGYDNMAVAYLINWIGPTLESTEAYDSSSQLSGEYSTLLHVNNVYGIAVRSNYTDNDQIKEAILKYGAVYTDIYVGYSYSGNNLYYSGTSSPNHAVVIVGWDDNYSRYNFNETPQGDGAFIVKNSWGNSSGDDGYYYVSYYDTSILASCDDLIGVGGFTFILNDTEVYNKQYQYDYGGLTKWLNVSSSSASIKNTYTSSGNDTIRAFGTYVAYLDQTYTAKLYINNRLVYTQTGTFSHLGYETVKFDESFNVSTNDIITIELTFSSNRTYTLLPISSTDYSTVVSTSNSLLNNRVYSDAVGCLKLYTVSQESSAYITTKIISNEYNNTSISIEIIDGNNNTITNGTITILEGDTEITSITINNATTTISLNNLSIGTHNITIQYSNSTYTTTTDIELEINKKNVNIYLPQVTGVIGENITLIAYLTDSNGNNITGGNIVFKINGVTLKSDGTFNSTGTALKISVVNGYASVTITATKYIRDAKNLTISYSGSSQYIECTSNMTTVEIAKRYANIRVTTNTTTAKQGTYIQFIATLTDTTKNSNTSMLDDNAYVFFKVNGVTLKDSDGNTIMVKVENNTAIYNYYIPTGTSTEYADGSIRDYIVTAVYTSNNYYPDSRDNTTFNIEKSITNIELTEIVINTTSNTLSIKANITDYTGENLNRTVKIAIKINGVTLTKNNKTVYYSITNGVINLNNITIPKSSNYYNVTIIVSESTSYESSRLTSVPVIKT
ncbi:MAG: hypothetical protein LUG89_00660 [Methanosphaera sp.]|nr:hypothetical protein [Methanosphaera sp.]